MGQIYSDGVGQYYIGDDTLRPWSPRRAPSLAPDLLSALSAMKWAQDKPGAQVVSGVPTIVFHGDQDTTVHPRNAESVIAVSAGPDVQDEAQRLAIEIGKRHTTRHVYRNLGGCIVAERWDGCIQPVVATSV